MKAETITVDGVEYRVAIVYPSRLLNFEIVEGNNTGMSLTFREIRDIGGTRYNYTMQVKPLPGAQAEFDAFLDVISAPVDYHRVVMPYGQKTLEFDAMIRSGSAIDHGMFGGVRKWGDLEITFEAIEPQRKPEG